MRRIKIMVALTMAVMVLLLTSGYAEDPTGAQLPITPTGQDTPMDMPIDDVPLSDDAIGNDGTTTLEFGALELDTTAADLDYSQKLTISATMFPSGEALRWSSSDETVAMLSADSGRSVDVVAVNGGTSTITCTAGSASQTCTVTVNAPQTLQITGVDYPATYTINGRGWKIRNGTVASTVDLASLTSVIKSANGEEVASTYTHIFEGGINRFELKGIDSYIPFSKMSDEGQFTWSLTATDVDGRIVSMDLPIVATRSGETVISSNSGVYASAAVAPSNAPVSSGATGGRNRIVNSDFAHNQLYWDDWGEPTVREFVQQDGKTWCHIVSTEHAKWQGLQQNPYNAHGITVTGYDRYTFSARVKGAAEDQKFTIGVHWCDDSGILSRAWNTWTIGTEEQTVSYTMTAAPGSKSFNLMLGVSVPDDATAYDIYFTDVMMEIGGTATAWSLAPEDANAVADGRNKILNSAFERKQENWNAWGAPMIREFVQQDGKTWCHIVSTENARWQGVQQNAHEAFDIDVRGYERYVFSAKVKAATENEKFTMGIHWRNEKEKISSTWNTWTIGPEEQIISFAVTAAPGSRGFNLMVGVDDVDSAIVHDIYFTDIKLEMGDTPTAWSPAPEDAA